MIANLAASSPIAVLATPQRSRWMLVALHVPMTAYLTLVCLTGLGVYDTDPQRVFDACVALALGAAQLVLSLRVASGRVGGERFALWALIVALAITPPLHGTDLRWLAACWFPAAAGGS